MNMAFPQRTVMVSLPIKFVEALLATHAELNDGLADALKLEICAGLALPCEAVSSSDAPPHGAGRYNVEFLGAHIEADTLPAIFAQVVDIMTEIAPEALYALAAMKARTRRFVALDAGAIHPGNRRLPVTQTKSGWWISKNIGQEDLVRALRALCCASGLEYGIDLKFRK